MNRYYAYKNVFTFVRGNSISKKIRFCKSKYKWMVIKRNRILPCSGKRVRKGLNDLQSLRPDLAAQWHPYMNGSRTPDQVSINSPETVWWLYPYTDPISCKQYNFQWKSPVRNRSRKGSVCPFLSGQAVWLGFNDLATKSPKLAEQWDYENNGSVTPQNITAGSEYNASWILPYDDPDTGKHFEFRWKATVHNRAKKGAGCPFLSGKAVWPGFNDLATKYPELAEQWDYENNGLLTPQNVPVNSNYNAYWVLPYDDPDTGKHFVFRWQAKVYNRTRDGTGCPFLSGQAVWPGFNDLATKYPELAEQWDYENNGSLTPQNVPVNSNYNAYWVLPYDDPDTGKHFVFRWQAKVYSRARNGTGCPFLSGKAVWLGFNDLATKHPELAEQWDYESNGNITPQKVTSGSNYNAFWIYHYDDPDTGSHFIFRWRASVNVRVRSGHGCPFLSGKTAWPGFNDLATKYPELAEQWDYERNGDIIPQKVTTRSNYNAWWVYPYDDSKTGRHFVFRWKATVYNRTRNKTGCPFLSGKAVWTGFNDLATKLPLLAKQWDYKKNYPLTPRKILYSSPKYVAWTLGYNDLETGKHHDFKWIKRLCNRSRDGSDCPYLENLAVWPGYNDLQTCYPEIAKEWNDEKNLENPSQVYKHSHSKYYWTCSICGNVFLTSVYMRVRYGVDCKCKSKSR